MGRYILEMNLDPDVYYRALLTRDPRFDGRIFVAVTSTGIYCRPVCPASPPRRENCRFYPSAAAAQDAGFRPCLRCRPETAPGLGPWNGTWSTVSRGVELIADGALNGEATVEDLANRLGVGSRQLRRLFTQHLGASPVAVAQTHRVLFAKHLLHETTLPMADVATAAGFNSQRRFNEVFKRLFNRPPSALRRTKRGESPASAGVTVTLRYRGSYDWSSMLGWLEARAMEGVESVCSGVYRRTIRAGETGDVATVEVAHPRDGVLATTIRVSDIRALPLLVAKVRRVFDLRADVDAIGTHLSKDPLMATLVAARPGLRCPGAWDGFELAIRAILGQQISVAAARRLAGRLIQICGEHHAVGWVFPTAAQVASADLDALGMPRARRTALKQMAEASLADPELFNPGSSLEQTIEDLLAIRGIGPWTAHYIALRAAREPDAFPASDVGLLRGAAGPDHTRPTPKQLLAQAEAWRPWRAYAAQHLWAADPRSP